MMQQEPTSDPLKTSPRLHISMVTETFPPEINGVTLTLSHLIAGLRYRGHRVTVVRPRQPCDRNRRIDPATAIVRGIPLPRYGALQCGLPSGRFLHRIWERGRPDAIYIATEGPLGWSAMRAALRLKIPTLSGFHTNFHAYSRYYRLGWLQAPVLQYLRYLHNHTNETLVPSQDLKQRLEGSGFQRVGVLGRGVDCEAFAPRYRCAELRRRWGLDEHGVAALYVGRLAPEKNLQVALEAYHAMRRAGGEVRLVLVGDGPLRQELARNHPDLIFCGVQTAEALARHYASGDVFLFPSETETFGNVTLEAMASGLAVMAYDYAAAREHVAHGRSGLLAALGDAAAFVHSAARMTSEPGLITQLRAAARCHAQSVSWASVIEGFERRLRQVVLESPSKRIAGQAVGIDSDLAVSGGGRI